MSPLTTFGAKALQMLGAVAPTIATAVGGPFAGVAVKALEGIFGASPSDATLLAATPDQLAALHKVDDDFKVQMQALGVEEEQLAYADTASARAREVSVRDYTPAVLAYSVTIGFFGTLFYVMAVGLKQIGSGQGGEAVLIMLGSLGTAWAGIMAYYFGSSTGAQKNAETIASFTKQTNGK